MTFIFQFIGHEGRIEDDLGNMIQSTARVTAYVNLIDPEVRGIHMSRLYLHLDQAFSDRRQI